jgi:hypothetical protein
MVSSTPSNTISFTHLSTTPLSGAEISAYDPATQTLFTTSAIGLQVIDLTDPANPSVITTIDMTA